MQPATIQASAKRAAFSLLEVICTVSLVALSGAILMVSVRGSQGRASSAALAETVSNELRSARQLAITRHSPVAVVFPSQNQSLSISDSMSIWVGQSFPKQVKVIRFGRDFPGCVLFNGSWAPQSGASVTTNLPLPGSKWASLDLDKWLPAAAKAQYCLVFCPDGTVKTNNLAAFNGAYHVLVSSGVAAMGTGPSPSGASPNFALTYRSPLVVGESRTICIDAGGAISVESGIVDSNIVDRGSMANAFPPAPSSPSVPLPAASGSILDVIVTSTGNPPAVPGDPDVTVALDGYVTLKTVAEDPLKSGQTLYCNWTVQKTTGSGSGDGAYSIPVASTRGTAMQWDPDAQSPGVGAWVSNWQWRPPADAGVNDRYLLSLVIQDADGTTVDVGTPRQVDVVPRGKVLFESNRAGPYALFTMNPNGTAERRFHIFPFRPNFPSPASEGWPSCSSDGSRIAFQSNRAGGTTMQIFLSDRSGSSIQQLTTNPGFYCECPGISPLGDRVAFRRKNLGTGNWELCVVDSDGSNLTVVENLGATGGVNGDGSAPDAGRMRDRISWESDNQTFYFTSGKDIRKITLGGGASTVAFSHGPDYCRAPCWYPGGHVMYSVDDGDAYIFVDGAVAARSVTFFEGQPCPWDDNGTWRAFVVRSTGLLTGQIWGYTPPMADIDPPNVRQLTSSGTDNRCPVFLP